MKKKRKTDKNDFIAMRYEILKTFTNNSIHYICTHNIFYYIFLHIYKIFWNNTDKPMQTLLNRLQKLIEMRQDKSEMKERLRIMRWWWGQIMWWEIESLVCANSFVNPFPSWLWYRHIRSETRKIFFAGFLCSEYGNFLIFRSIYKQFSTIIFRYILSVISWHRLYCS